MTLDAGVKFGLVAVAQSVGFELTYRIPEELADLPVGMPVLVTVQRKARVGVFMGEVPAPRFACADIIGHLPHARAFPGTLIRLIQWVSQYYLAPFGRCAGLLAPGFLWDASAIEKRDKRFAKLTPSGAMVPEFPTLIRGELGGGTRSDGTRSDETRSDETRSDETRSDKTRSDETRSDETRSDETRSDETRSETRVGSERRRKPKSADNSPKTRSTSARPAEAPSLSSVPRTLAPLSDAQQAACDLILQGAKPVTLLQGITGSGKTEVYLHAVRRVLDQGRSALILVPEIALTPQMSARFRAAFGDALAILHSGLTQVEYEREWFRVNLGQARVVLGVRSAVFAPLADVGLIVVDEEHDQSYKCDEFPCYQARDVAVKRAQLEEARCVLGSATPSLESHHNVRQDRYQHARLLSRFSGGLPQAEVIDARLFVKMAKAARSKSKEDPVRSSSVAFRGHIIAPPIVDALAATQSRGEQSMLIINRRGFAQYSLCTTCGQALSCPHCAVTTTLHKFGQVEMCHYCGFSRATLKSCPHCSQPTLLSMGTGTQNIEAELAEVLPHLKTARLDRDMLTSNSRLTSILEDFRTGTTDCLIGTQILSKGHDFPRVTLVAILHVEDGLYLPDYRSAERTFQLITQAAGRAGRGSLAGKVLLQSLVPGHPVVDAALAGDVDGFLGREHEMRALGWHPPVSRQILFEFKSRSEEEALALGNKVRLALVEYWQKGGLGPEDVRLSGPYPATIERLREEFRFQMCISAQKHVAPARLVPLGLHSWKEVQGKMRIDVDPYSFL